MVTFKNKIHAVLAVLYCLLFFSPAVSSHALSPSLLEINEEQGGLLLVRIKEPARQAYRSQVHPVLPSYCRGAGQPAEQATDQYRLVEYRVDCGQAGLSNLTVAVPALQEGAVSLVLKSRRLSGAAFTAVLNAGNTEVVIPDEPSTAGVFSDYFALGMHHLITGLDHLLFLTALVLLVQQLRPLVAVITAFTVGHALTIVLVTLGVLSVSSLWVEMFIPLSILLLTLDVYYKEDFQRSTRFTLVVCATFGLLHGMGFASALNIAELGRGDKALALLAFNLGIETVQLLVVVSISILLLLLLRVCLSREKYVLKPAAVVLGAIAGLWFWERLFVSLSVLQIV